jgi:hypothetical protein
VKDHNNKIRRMADCGVALSQDEKQILAMTTECEALALKLTQMLEKLAIRQDAMLPRWEMIKKVIILKWKQSDIDGLQHRLGDLDLRLRTSVNLILQKYVETTIECSVGIKSC